MGAFRVILAVMVWKGLLELDVANELNFMLGDRKAPEMIEEIIFEIKEAEKRVKEKKRNKKGETK